MNRLKNKRKQIRYDMFKHLKEKSNIYNWDSLDLLNLRDSSIQQSLENNILEIEDIDIIVNYLVNRLVWYESEMKSELKNVIRFQNEKWEALAKC